MLATVQTHVFSSRNLYRYHYDRRLIIDVAMPTVAKKLRALDHAITTRFDYTVGRDIEAAREEMDIRMKERNTERI